MSKKLFLFTISPVQSFIAQARKMRDLQGGSFLLSELINTAIQKLKDRDSNFELIYPTENVESKPNRILGITELEKDKFQEIENVVRQDYVTKVKTKIDLEHHSNNPKFSSNVTQQLDSLLEISWAAVELPQDSEYKQNYEELGKYLASLKNYRKFSQIQEERARKCALCGERNALFYRERSSANKPQYIHSSAQKVQAKQENLFTLGEALCAVCFGKRMFLEKVIFESTADIASANLLYSQETKLKEKIEEYKKLFDNHFEGQLLYEENLTPKYFEKHGLAKYSSQLSTLKDKLKAILKQAKELNLTQSSYYALILFDGDNMGKTLSGEFLKTQNNLKEFHKQLSQSLGDFASECKEHLNANLGQTIYAGGDDFLGFVNLTILYDVLQKFLDLFEQKVNENLKEYLQDKKKLSYSAGVVIAHYKTPLSEVLKWAREMEKKAKANENKASFGMAVLKHSGDINSFVYSWKYEELNTISVMQNLTKLLKEKFISNTFIKQLQVEFLPLLDQNESIDSEMFELELERLFLRSVQKSSEQNEERKQQILSLLQALKNISEKSILNFFNFLNISDFIHRQV